MFKFFLNAFLLFVVFSSWAHSAQDIDFTKMHIISENGKIRTTNSESLSSERQNVLNIEHTLNINATNNDSLYIDPLEMDTKNVMQMKEIHDNNFTLTVMGISFIATLFLSWSVRLFFGISSSKRTPFFINKQMHCAWQQLQKEQNSKWLQTINNSQEKRIMKLNAVFFFSLSTVLFSYLYYFYVQDEKIYEEKFSNSTIIWDENCLFKNQAWNLSKNKIILDQKGHPAGKWRAQNNQLFLTITTPEVFKTNTLSAQKVKYHRTLNFTPVENSNFWHAYDYKITTKNTIAITDLKNKYEIGRIKILYSGK